MEHKLSRLVWGIFLSTVFFSSALAQVDDKKDSVVIQDIELRQSRNFDESLENYRNKNKFNRFIHRLFVKKPGTKKAERTSERFGEIDINFSEFEGKT